MNIRTVTLDQIDVELKRIEREGTERLVSVVPSPTGDWFEIKTEERADPPLETR